MAAAPANMKYFENFISRLIKVLFVFSCLYLYLLAFTDYSFSNTSIQGVSSVLKVARKSIIIEFGDSGDTISADVIT